MTSFDLAPFQRSSVGFDRLFELLDNAGRLHAVESWPQYDIAKTSENGYRITMVAAGFEPDDLDITQTANTLVVKGAKSEPADGDMLHRGISSRAFERRFDLADFVTVREARLENGLLSIDLVQEVPEEMKPRRIAVGSAHGATALAA